MNKITLNKSLRKLASNTRWRTEKNCQYYYIDAFFRIGINTYDHIQNDTIKYNYGNYFRTMKDAETVLNQIREILNEYDRPERIRYIPYYYIHDMIYVGFFYDCGNMDDEELYNVGNYFRTEEDAEMIQTRIREILNNH